MTGLAEAVDAMGELLWPGEDDDEVTSGGAPGDRTLNRRIKARADRFTCVCKSAPVHVAASAWHRPGWEKLTMAWAALAGLMPKRLVRPGGDVIDDGPQPGAVVLGLLPDLAQRLREAADLGLADGMFAGPPKVAANISGLIGLDQSMSLPLA